MQGIAWSTLAPMLILSAAVAARGQDKPATPAEQYELLLKEYRGPSNSGRPLSDEERLKFVGQAYKQRFKLGVKLLELAEKVPEDPIAFEALTQAVWQVNGTPWPVELVGEDSARAKAFEILQRKHVQSDKLGALYERISYGYCEEYETFLRAVLMQNPHKEIQATACLSLGHFLHNRALHIELCKEQPDLARDFEGLFGKEYIERLLQRDSADAIKEAEAVLTEASEKHGDVTLSSGRSVAERANAELFEIRNLCVGKEAPDIEGLDQEGTAFKLSDYRGKVVLLDFWSYV